MASPVQSPRPWPRIIAGIVAVFMVYFALSGGTSSSSSSINSIKSTTTLPSAASLAADLAAARLQSEKYEKNAIREKGRADAAYQELEHVRARLDALEAEHAKHAEEIKNEHHQHGVGMQTKDPTRKVLHPVVGRNEDNRWSDLDLDITKVRRFARVEDDWHMCLPHSWPPYYNNSDMLCTLDVVRHASNIPLNITLQTKEFDKFIWVPNCPPLFARQVCDLEIALPRLSTLINERKTQEPLPALPLTATRDPSTVRLAYFIEANRGDFLLSTSVEALERLLRRIAHPNDIVLLHLDRVAGSMFAEVSVGMVMAENFTFVREVLAPQCITSSGAVQTEVQLLGFKRLLELCSKWDHAIYLTNYDFPIRTRNELIAQLKPGMSYFPLQELNDTQVAVAANECWETWFTDCPNPTGNNLFRLATRSMLTGPVYARSDNVYVLSRELVEWLARDEFANLLWLYFRTTLHAQEYYLPTAVATDRRFLNRVERKSLIYFELDLRAKSLPARTARHFMNNTEDRELIRKSYDSGNSFFVHRPRPLLYPFLDQLRDPTWSHVDPPPAKGHEH